MLRWSLALLLGACGARSGLEVDESPRDAATPDVRDVGLPDVPPDVPFDVPPDVPFDVPADVTPDVAACDDPPCECFAEGELTWEGVYYCGTGSDLSGCNRDIAVPGWGEPMLLEASCRGRYTICASVESVAGCPMAEVCGTGSITNVDNPARIRMPSFFAGGDECTREALEETGGHACLSVRWTATDGTTGNVELGCFANFGPFCFGVRCGGGGEPGPGAGGSWSF